MSGTASYASILAALQAGLDANVVEIIDSGGSWSALIDQAAARLASEISLTRRADLSLIAGEAEYTAPDDLIGVGASDWGSAQLRDAMPWEVDYPGVLPTASKFTDGTSEKLQLDPAPTAGQIALYGATYRFTYRAAHVLHAEQSTIPETQKAIIVLMASIEAMLFIAKRNSGKPVTFRDGYTGTPKNGTPAALAEQLEEQLAARLKAHRRLAG